MTTTRLMAVLFVLKHRYTTRTNQGFRLHTWPKWLRLPILNALEAAKLAYHVNYGPASYGHTEYFLY